MDKRLGGHKTTSVPRISVGPGGEPPFVGRDEEMRRLAEALALAAKGKGGVVFVTGEPGIGKTRLAQEALALAKERGFIVLQGRAYPLGGCLAYAPIVDSLVPLLRSPSAEGRSLDSARLENLVKDLPSLGRLFEGVGLPFPSQLKGLGDAALEKTRLFEALMRLLERLTQEAPIALFVDDLHWADAATIELLHYIARGLSDQRALLLATYGADALNSSAGLRALVGPLLRDGLAEEMILSNLQPGMVDRLVQGILGGGAPSELLALIDARAAGTPLFVKAQIYALVESGHLVRVPFRGSGWVLDVQGAADLPPSVRRLVLERLERLEPVDRHVLDMIAIMDDATPHTILRVASGLEEETLIGSLSRLMAAGLVAERVDGSDLTYTITHPLVREVSYTELPEAARRRAHLAAIAALESFSDGRSDDVNRLARHYRGAGPDANRDQALAVLVAAGSRALAVYANEEAARHYSAALATLRDDRLTRAREVPFSPSTSTLSEVLERLGEAWERMGEGVPAIRMWNEALAERKRSGDAVAVSRLHRRLALAEWDRGNFDVANDHLRAGLAALAGRDPCGELADLHHTRFRILSRLGDVAAMAEITAELLSVAERLALPRATAEANLADSICCLWRDDIAGARERALFALQGAGSFSEGRELAIRCLAHNELAAIGMYGGDHRFMRYYAERGLDLAKRLGMPFVEVILRLRLANANFMSGAWEESLQDSIDAIGLARRIGQPRDLACALAERALILAMRGDLALAEGCISEIRQVFGRGTSADRGVFGVVEIAEATLALERGQGERALAIARRFLRPSASAATSVGLTAAKRPTGFALLAEAQVAAGDGVGALETARRIIGLGPAGTPYLAALASRAEGLARQALREKQPAMECLRQAHEEFTALEMPFEAARSLLELAEVGGQETGARDQTPSPRSLSPERAAQQSLATFERLGARRYAERARRLLRGFGFSPPVTLLPRLGGVSVSERELEVARLVAEGLTATEIARRLTISPRTVTTHLEHIYARLHISSRAALVRQVMEAGLLNPQDHNT